MLDGEDGPGGAWRHRWDSLTIGKARRIADLPHFPAGELDETLPSSRVVADYYGAFERERGLSVQRPVRPGAVRLSPAATLRLRQPSQDQGEGAHREAAASSGIRMDGRVSVAADPRVLLVGYGDSASTLGATHAGSEAARVAVERLSPGRPARPADGSTF